MNNINEQYKVIIVDVDGTLYSKKELQKYMICELLKYYILHIWKLPYLYGLYKFRQYRNKETTRLLSNDDIIEYISTTYKLNEQILTNTIDKWIFKIPLKYIPKCAYTELIDYLNNLDTIRIYVYSDYKPYDKLRVLHLDYIKAFYPDMKHIKELKPSYDGMIHILSEIKTKRTKILYIGDSSRDKYSAALMHIQYIDIIHFIDMKKRS